MLKNKRAVLILLIIIIISIFALYKYNKNKSDVLTNNSDTSINNNIIFNKKSKFLTGVSIHSLEMKNDEIEKISNSGFKIVRIDLFWSFVENQKGVYDFSKYDKFVNSMEKNNIKILFILDYSNKLYDNGLSPHTDEGRKAFANFAKAAVKRYRGKQIMWEIWNEPNGFFWKPNPNWEDYFKLAMETINEIKSVDKNAFIVAPASSEIHYDFFSYLGKAGLFKYINAVSVHPYRQSNPETAIQDYKNLKFLINDHPHNKDIQIFSDEWGYSTSWKGMNDMKQAQYCVRQYLINIMSGVKLSIWYDWKDDGNDKNNAEHNFGIMYNDLTPKPIYYAVKTMNNTLNGYNYVKRVDTASKDDYVLMFKKDNEVAYAAWTTNGKSHNINIDVSNNDIKVVEFMGDNYKDKAPNNKYKINLDESVKYILN